jgi:hypothetical protein
VEAGLDLGVVGGQGMGRVRQVTVIDAREIDEPENADEVLALHFLYATDGESIVRHTEWCRSSINVRERCTCTPQTLTIGAKA